MDKSAIEINRTLYEDRNEERHFYKAKPGLSEEVVREISRQKEEPEWMLEKRLKAFEYYKKKPIPKWGPDLSALDLDSITYFLRPDAKENATRWEDVPADIKKTFEKLGIPEAERKVLAGTGAQYESSVVYHKLKEEWEKLGVIFLDMDEAVRKHPDLVKQYFMTKCVPINDHKFISLHGAVWSGGTFIYIPKRVKVGMPLQAYFRMNAPSGGQFEHTLIIADEGSEISYIEGCSSPIYKKESLHAGCVEIYVGEGARVRYSSVENWSKNTYNLNTKRAVVEKNGIIEWIGGNMGAGCTMLYPCSILKGEGARADHIGLAVASKGQVQDTGAKVIHLAKNTSSTIKSKSISTCGGITTYRGLLKIVKGAEGSKSHVQCDALIMDDISKSNTFPTMEVMEEKADVAHEATVGKISEEQLFYVMSRGISAEEALKMIVVGFMEPIIKELPLEYAVEMNRLIELELEGSVG